MLKACWIYTEEKQFRINVCVNMENEDNFDNCLKYGRVKRNCWCLCWFIQTSMFVIRFVIKIVSRYKIWKFGKTKKLIESKNITRMSLTQMQNRSYVLMNSRCQILQSSCKAMAQQCRGEERRSPHVTVSSQALTVDCCHRITVK